MRNTSRRVLFVLCAVVLAALSGGVSWATAQSTATPGPAATATAASTASAAPTLTAYSLPASVEFHFQSQTPAHEAALRTAVEAAYSYV